MGVVFQVKVLCAAGLLLLFNPVLSMAQQNCSLVVKVVDIHDNEVPGAIISLAEQNGRTINTTSRLGGNRFCDLGILSVTVTVGHPACNQITLRNIPLEWGQTRIAKIVYDREPCLIDTPPVAACSVLFRFADEQGRWIAGVSIDSPDLAVLVSDPRQSDQFGRIRVSFAAGREPQIQTKSDGYISKIFDLRCTREQPIPN
jgi:hypothetical protein